MRRCTNLNEKPSYAPLMIPREFLKKSIFDLFQHNLISLDFVISKTPVLNNETGGNTRINFIKNNFNFTYSWQILQVTILL